MTRDIKLSLEASDVFELRQWLDEMQQERWRLSTSANIFTRRGGAMHTIEARLALLEKLVNAIKE